MATIQDSKRVRWTRKDAIERLIEAVELRHGYLEQHGEWLAGALDRFARKVLKEGGYAKDIAASTETLTLRERVRTLEGRIGVMATMARPTMGECPPGKDGAGSECEDCPESMKCEECWREWGLS